MSKHTPGPWYAVGYWIEVENDDVPDIATFNPAALGQSRLPRDNAETLANVRLCAAATPDGLPTYDKEKALEWVAQLRDGSKEAKS